jgi:hypothetical protein
MWTNGSVEGLALKIVAQNTVGHRLNVVSASSRDRALTSNSMMVLLNGSVEGLALKFVAQNTVDHRVNVVSASSRDRALTSNSMMIILTSLLPGIYLLACLVALSFFLEAICKPTLPLMVLRCVATTGVTYCNIMKFCSLHTCSFLPVITDGSPNGSAV